MLNPGGSIKDRVALEIVKEALESGELRPGGLISEGTVGSTGVSLAMVGALYAQLIHPKNDADVQVCNRKVAKAIGCKCHIAMPDDAAMEKVEMLEALGEV